MASKAEIGLRLFGAAALAGGAVTGKESISSHDTLALSSSESTPIVEQGSMPSQATSDCEVPFIVDVPENTFSLNGTYIGGNMELWNSKYTTLEDGSMGFKEWEYDGRKISTPEDTSFYIPEGMIANAVITIDGKERSFSIHGGEDAVICGDEYQVMAMTLDTQPFSYNEELAGTWQELDVFGNPINGRAPVGVDPEEPFILESEESPADKDTATPPPTSTPITPTATPSVEEATIVPTPEQVPQEAQQPRSEDVVLNAEQVELVEVTAVHLEKIYGGTMSEKYYPDKDARLNFFRELTMMGIRLNPDNPNFANQLAAVMRFETAGSFAPDQPNLQGSDAIGLIQFMSSTAESMGTTRDQLAQMSPVEQLVYVEKYLADRQVEAGVKIRTLHDAYLAVFWPAGMGQGGEFVLFEQGTDAYASNGGVLDLNKDGKVTADETIQAVLDSSLSQGEKWQFLLTDGTSETMPSLDRQLELVHADAPTMQKIADANTQLYGNATYQYLCLQGVRLSISQVMPEMNAPLLVNSAYLVNDVFTQYPDRFTQLVITNEEQLYELPAGAILVYPRNTESMYDFAVGQHHGHISIIIGENGDGEMVVGSDHHTLLSKDLENMENTPVVWVPVQRNAGGEVTEEVSENQASDVPENAAGGSITSADLTTSEQLAIGYDYGQVPEYYPESGEYQEALKSEFGVIMNGFTDEEMRWAWELLWSVSDTNFPVLVEGIIYTKEGEEGGFSEQVQCGWNGETDVEFASYSNEVQFKNLLVHEAGHYIHCRDWVETEGDLLEEMDQIMMAEGAVSAYGEGDSHENFADMIMYALNPADGFVSVGEGSPENPIYNGSKPLHKEFAMRILTGPLEGLPTAPEPVARG